MAGNISFTHVTFHILDKRKGITQSHSLITWWQPSATIPYLLNSVENDGMFPLEIYFTCSSAAQWAGAKLPGFQAPLTSCVTVGNSLSVSLCPWL